MFYGLTKYLRNKTAISLTLKFAAVFLLAATILFGIVDHLLERSLLEKDQQLIGSWLESYQRLDMDAGLEKTRLVLDRDSPYLRRSSMWVELFDTDGDRLMLVKPTDWDDSVTILDEDQPGPSLWTRIELKTGKQTQVLLTREVSLQEGRRLRIGISSSVRQAQLASYRALMLQVALPLIFLSIMLTAYINWRALLPVHDLIDTVRKLRVRELDVRVPVRNQHSELGELATLFNQMLAQIEALIQGMQQSLDNVAHDLRTPLSRMRLSLEEALAGDDLHQLKEALMDCAEESERIDGMLRILMDLSEAESGALQLRLESFDINRLIEETVELYGYHAEEKGVELLSSTITPLQLVSDRTRIRQVLGNLVDNAIKYTPYGGKVNIHCFNTGEIIHIRVEDNGIGISGQDSPHIFDRLYRADQSRHKPGMGLGLSLVRALVEACGGEISVSSKLTRGSRFEVTLPGAGLG